ncbi:MAG: peptidoglycan DD-metalloendopeptidase family protein, partial [Patescibacteria group bacterium]
TPTPIPGPVPFLDLPWDYKSLGKSFEDVALNPVSWFDHQYPLQNIPCCIQDVTIYTGKRKTLFYKSHNGYDYGAKNGVVLNTPVLAAASGIATFKSAEHSGGAGNVIKIDHENGYQTWYEHLAGNDLIVSSEGTTVSVQKGQVIGRVGMTGNTSGPHIHFSVFKDTNNNNVFDDDYPYGVVDPLGWEGENPDSWSLYSSGGKNGTISYNLFTARAKPKSTTIQATGGNLNENKVSVGVPDGAYNTVLALTLRNGPFEQASQFMTSVAYSFFLDAIDNLGQKVTQFLKPIKLTYDYSNANLFNINEDTIKLYTFNEQSSTWEELLTILDKTNKTAYAETLHFSQFSIMGEVKDLIAPTTATIISGDKGKNNWYRSNIKVELNGKDNDGGVGLQYTLYTLNDNDWFIYESPLIFNKEGSYKITYQSYDKAENKEDPKVIEFNIDKTIPEAKIFIDQDKQDLVVEGIDKNQPTVKRLDNTESKKKDDAVYVIKDLSGNTIRLDVRERDKEKNDRLNIYSIQYNQDSLIELPDNKLIVKYKGKKDKLNVDEQRFEIKKEVKIRIKYDQKKNQSTITTRVNGQDKIKETRDGLVLLQITTEKGTINYNY